MYKIIFSQILFVTVLLSTTQNVFSMDKKSNKPFRSANKTIPKNNTQHYLVRRKPNTMCIVLKKENKVNPLEERIRELVIQACLAEQTIDTSNPHMQNNLTQEIFYVPNNDLLVNDLFDLDYHQNNTYHDPFYNESLELID